MMSKVYQYRYCVKAVKGEVGAGYWMLDTGCWMLDELGMG